MDIQNICDYGCGKIAITQFKNGKYCCSERTCKCDFLRNKLKESKQNFWNNLNEDDLIKFKILQSKITKQKWKDENKLGSIEHKQKISDSLKKRSPEIRLKQSQKCKQTWNTNPNLKENLSRKTKSMWMDGGIFRTEKYKQNLKNSIKKSWDGNDKRRKVISKITKQKWKDENSKHRSKETMNKKSKSLTGLKRSNEIKTKLKLSWANKINTHIKNEWQTTPSYSRNACKIIDEYGKQNNYNFQHAENGGEFLVKGLGYWVDGYDKEKNVVIEIDEASHYDENGILKEKDKKRQLKIEKHLNCKFIRIRI